MNFRTALSFLALAAISQAAQADIWTLTPTIEGDDVVVNVKNKSDVPFTLSSVRLLGPAVDGKESPTLAAVNPRVTIAPGTITPIKVARAVQVREWVKGSVAEFPLMCVGDDAPCTAGLKGYESRMTGVGMELKLDNGSFGLSSLTVHLVRPR